MPLMETLVWKHWKFWVWNAGPIQTKHSLSRSLPTTLMSGFVTFKNDPEAQQNQDLRKLLLLWRETKQKPWRNGQRMASHITTKGLIISRRNMKRKQVSMWNFSSHYASIIQNKGSEKEFEMRNQWLTQTFSRVYWTNSDGKYQKFQQAANHICLKEKAVAIKHKWHSVSTISIVHDQQKMVINHNWKNQSNMTSDINMDRKKKQWHSQENLTSMWM